MTAKADPYNLAELPIEQWNVSDLKPYERNTKVHDENHVIKLARSIKADGLYDAIIVDATGVIIAGHGRWAAVTKLGWAKVPVKVAKNLSKNQADAARIAHNKTSSTEYHSDYMAEELQRLAEADDVDVTVFMDDHEIEMLIEDVGDMDMGALSTDLDADIDQQEQDSKDMVEQVDNSEEKIVKVLGFNSIPISASKEVRRFMADVEAETGKEGAEAFVEWCSGRP